MALIQPDDMPAAPTLDISVVWRAVFFLIALQSVISGVLFVLFEFFGLTVPSLIRPFVQGSMVVLPLLLWAVVIWYPLRLPALPLTCIVAMLTANGAGLPLFNTLFSSDVWLATQTTTNRIVGYALTLGALHVFAQYLVLRYLAWHYVATDDHAVIYAVTIAVGYTTVMSFSLLENQIALSALSARAFAHFAVFTAANLFLAYGLARVQLDNALFLLMPLTIALTSGFVGLVTTIRSGIQNASFAVAVTAPRPLFGLVFSLIVIVSSAAIVYFFFNRIAVQRALASDDT